MTTKTKETWEESEDYKLAVRFANELLDEPYADPDDHSRTVARQFLSMIDRYSSLQKETEERVIQEILNLPHQRMVHQDSGSLHPETIMVEHIENYRIKSISNKEE